MPISVSALTGTIFRSQERRNALANIAGKGFNLVFAVMFVPLYLSLLGHEAYGVVALQTTLQVIFSFLELGLPATVTREIALHRSSVTADKGHLTGVISTSEAVAAVVGLVVVITIMLLSPLIASKWLIVTMISQVMVTQTLCIMGCQVGVQFVSLVYTGALVGAGRQVLQNGIVSSGALIRGLGSVGILWIFPDIRLFLLVQLLSAVMVTGALRVGAYQAIGATRGRVSRTVLKRMFPFASQIVLNSLVLTIAGQLDRLIMSKTMPVSYLGYYSLAIFVSSGIMITGTSVITAMYPGLVHDAGRVDSETLERRYLSRLSGLNSILIPLTFFLIFFGHDVMLCWTRDIEVATATRIALPCLALSSYLSAINQMPVSLAAARGFMYPAIVGQLLLTLVLAVPTYLIIGRLGLEGAAYANLTANGLYSWCITPIIYRYLGLHHHRGWIKTLVCGLDFPALLTMVGICAITWIIDMSQWTRLAIGGLGLCAGLYMTIGNACGGCGWRFVKRTEK